MKFKTALALLFVLAFPYGVHAGTTAEDLLNRAKRSGIDTNSPVSIVFEWRRTQEGANAEEVANVLRAARFVVTTSTTKHLSPSRDEYKTTAQWTGLVQQGEVQQIIKRLDTLTAGQGSVNWQVTQIRR